MEVKVGGAMLTTIIISVLAGGLVTGGTMYAIEKRNTKDNENTVEIIDAIANVKSEVAQSQLVSTTNLTNTDLLKEPCSKEYIADNGDLLCREMFCRLQARGLDSSASQGECEQISNVKNSLIILEACHDREDAGAYQACIQVFNQRK
jgi:hypothetical protein